MSEPMVFLKAFQFTSDYSEQSCTGVERLRIIIDKFPDSETISTSKHPDSLVFSCVMVSVQVEYADWICAEICRLFVLPLHKETVSELAGF